MWSVLDRIIAGIQGYVAYIRSNDKIKREKLLAALLKLQRAANLTRATLAQDAADEAGGSLPNYRPTDDGYQRRQQVSESWLEVAEALGNCQDNYRESHIHDLLNELMNRCFQKGAFWAAPDGWEDSGADIRLSSLVQETSKQIQELRRELATGRK